MSKHLARLTTAAAALALVAGPGLLAPVQASPTAGTIVSIAGGGVDDGAAATAVPLGARWAAFRPNGDLIIADARHNRIRSVASDGTISTLAGNGATADGHGTYGGDDGPATMAGFYNPSAAAVAANGDVVVLDQFNRRVRLIDHLTGVVRTIAGNGSPGSAVESSDATTQPMTPTAIADDPSTGDVYIGDDTQGVVWRLAPDGSLHLFAGGGSGTTNDAAPATSVKLWGVNSLAVMPDGSLLIGSVRAQTVRQVKNGTITIVAGASQRSFTDGAQASTTATYAQSLAVAPDNTIYVGGPAATPVTFTVGGTFHVVAGAPCATVTSFDTGGRPLLACNAVFDQGTDGSWQRLAGLSATNGVDDRAPDGTRATSAALAVSAAVQTGQNTYVGVGSALDLFGADGSVHPVAGTPGASKTTGDGGPAAAATFSSIWQLGAAPDGGVFVQDFNVIRLITSDGVIHPYIGQNATPYTTSDPPPPDGEDGTKLGYVGAWTAGANGDIYVSNTATGAINVVDWSDHIVHTVIPDLQRLGGKTSSDWRETADRLAAAPDGSLLVLTDQSFNNQPATTSRLLRIDPATKQWSELYAGPALSALTVGTDGTPYVISSDNRYVDAVGSDGSLTSVAGGGDQEGPAQPVGSFYVPAANRLAPAADGGVLLTGYGGGLFELQPGWIAPAIGSATNGQAHTGTGSDGHPDLTVSWTPPSSPPSLGHYLVTILGGPQPAAPASPDLGQSLPLDTTQISYSYRTPGMRYVVSIYVVDDNGDLSAPLTVASVTPGDTTPPARANATEGLSLDSSATFVLDDPNDADLAAVDFRMQPGATPPDSASPPSFSDYPSVDGGSRHTISGLTIGQRYTYTLTARDFSGNTTVTGPSTFTAGSAPEVTFTAGPADGGYSKPDVEFDYNADGLPGGVRCWFDGAPLPCNGAPIQLSSLNAGSHDLRIQQYNNLGSGPTVIRHWTVDDTAPTVTLSALPLVSTTPTATVHYGGFDTGSGIASYNVRYEHANFNTTWSAWTTLANRPASGTAISLQPGNSYCVQVQSTDRAGNTSPWSSLSCTTMPLDDRALTAGPGWKSRSGNAFYLHTYRSTSKAGATLTRAGGLFDRLAIVATRCPTCGSIKVIVGRTTIATISLHARTTKRQWVYVLPKLALRSGTVRIVDARTGPTVQIDGLVISRI